jgi:hypothetical protein
MLEDNSAELDASADMQPDDVNDDIESHLPSRPGMESVLSMHQELLQIRALLTV